MSERANTFKIGVFTLVATGLTLLGITVLGAGALFQKTTPVETYLTESVQGLELGAPVKLRGVEIGRVTRISFVGSKYPVPDADRLASGYVLVEMEIYEDRLSKRFSEDPEANLAVALAHGLRVRMASAGLMGQAFLELVFLGEDAPPPLEIVWTPDVNYIPSSQSVLGQITSAVERLARQLEEADIAGTVRKISALVANVDQKVEAFDVKSLESNANGLLTGLQDTNNRIQAILNNPNIDTMLAGAGEGFKDIPATIAHIRGAAGELEQILASEETRQLLTNLGATAKSAAPASDQLRLLLTRIDRLVADQQSDIEGLLASLRATAQNLQELTEDARQNPSRLFFGKPPARDDFPSKGAKK